MSDTATVILVAAIAALSALFAFGIEPHWSSRDGRRFIARAAWLERHDRSPWVEVRGRVIDGRITLVARRSRHELIEGDYRMVRIADDTRRVAIVHLTRLDGTGPVDALVRLPRRSRTLAVIVAEPNGEAAPED